MKRLAMAIGLALFFAAPASAQLYKWVDSNGKVQYSDKPPPSNIKTERLRTPPPAPSPAAAGESKEGAQKDAAKTGPRTAKEQEQAFRKRQIDARKADDEAAQKQAETGEKAENCKRAKAALASLQIGGRMARIDEKGERVIMGDLEIAQATAKAQQEADAACR